MVRNMKRFTLLFAICMVLAMLLSGVALADNGMRGEAIHIRTLAQLEAALNSQADGQTWLIHEGTYTLTDNNANYKAPEFGGFFGVVTADGVTIQGIGKAGSIIINSRGSAAYTGTLLLLGDDITVDGLTFQPNLDAPNRTVDVAGANATVRDCIINGGGGAMYIPAEFNAQSLGKLTITHNVFDNAMLCFDSAATARSITISHNTFNMGPSNYYAIGNVTWTAPPTTNMATIAVLHNKFITNSTGKPIIRNRMTGSFLLWGNTVDHKQPQDWSAYLLLQTRIYGGIDTDPTVFADGYRYYLDDAGKLAREKTRKTEAADIS